MTSFKVLLSLACILQNTHEFSESGDKVSIQSSKKCHQNWKTYNFVSPSLKVLLWLVEFGSAKLKHPWLFQTWWHQWVFGAFKIQCKKSRMKEDCIIGKRQRGSKDLLEEGEKNSSKLKTSVARRWFPDLVIWCIKLWTVKIAWTNKNIWECFES